MTVFSMRGRLTASLILTLSLTSLAFANDRADAGRTETGASRVPSVHAPPAQVGPLTDTATLGGAVPWATIAPPPAWGAAGGSGATLVQGGGGGTPQLRYYALDALGSVRVVFDAAGAVVSRADYEPFGAVVPASTTGTLPRQQFTGQERDGEVGVDYFGARMYGPQHGRMLSVDPLYAWAIGDPQRWNRYAHALNSPEVMVDPDGRSQCNGVLGNNSVGHCSGPPVVWPSEYTHPAYVQEHNPFLFLLMGYSNYGYGGGGSVTVGPPLPPPTLTTADAEPDQNVVGPGPGPGPKPDPPVQDTRKKKSCVPAAPPGHGPATIVANTWTTAISMPVFGPALTAGMTINRVRSGGAWDYAGKGVFQDFGNFNYGAVMAAMGVPQQTALRLAGLYQMYSDWRDEGSFGQGTPLGGFPYGDDAPDARMVAAGWEFAAGGLTCR